ncbi:alpha-kinase [Fragilaria crotonensis]|nr:alpha-kinase [Fragilaria crotonensis]
MASRDDGTELSSLLSSPHGRERREERGIQKIDLQRARRYGIREAAYYGRVKYTYGGIVFIYDEVLGREVTSFPSRDLSSDASGTKVVPPVILEKNEAYMSSKYLTIHECHKRLLMLDHSRWTSHSVFVVDMSGSMRRDDVSGGKCRSDAVWMVLAKDFVQAQLEAKAVTGCDVVSIILMRDEAELVVEHEPLDWILYNKLIDMREWSQSRPSGPGNYLPALELAESLLASNSSGTCALSLVFFSDGKPSDRGPFVAKMGEIASQYRRRLTFNCIGIAQAAENEAFETLHAMVSEADAFGAKSSFTAPSLDATSLSNIISSVSSSLTSTKTEMTDLATGETRAVRQDVRSERQGTADDLWPTEQWDLYGLTKAKSVGRIWSWSSEKDDFVILQDPRCVFCERNPTIRRCSGAHVVKLQPSVSGART